VPHYETEHEVTALRGDRDQTSHLHHGRSQIKLAGPGLLFSDGEHGEHVPETVTRPRLLKHVTQTRVTRRGENDFLKRRSPSCSEFEPRQVVKEPGLGGAILTSSSCSFIITAFFFSHPDLRHRLLSIISHSRPFLTTRHSRQVSRTVYPTSITNRTWLLAHL
jgi:hypothetical protein